MAKSCFVISIIGDEGTEQRRHADKVLKHVISPVVSQTGYGEPQRAEHDYRPGMIPEQVIQKLLSCDLVIADLSVL
jgi:hypothetical protein